MGDFNNPYDSNNQQPNNTDQQPQDPQQNNPQADYQQPGYQQPIYQQPQYQQPQYDGQSQNQSQNQQQSQQQNQQYNQYQQTSYNQYQQPVQRKFNPLALASLICGGVSFLFSCCLGGLSIVISIAGVVLGIITLTKKPLENKNDKTMAIIGIVLSGVGIISGIIVTIFSFAVLGNLSNYY